MGVWIHWIRGFVGSVIGGAANSISVVIIDPQNFNLTDGWRKLASFAVVSALISGALFLKQSPLPDDADKVSPNWKEPK